MIVLKVLGWTCLVLAGLLAAGTVAVVLADWYHRLRRRRREQAAAEATQRARRERLDRDRAITAAMGSQFTSEGEAR